MVKERRVVLLLLVGQLSLMVLPKFDARTKQGSSKQCRHPIVQHVAQDLTEVYDNLTFVLKSVNEFDATDAVLLLGHSP